LITSTLTKMFTLVFYNPLFCQYSHRREYSTREGVCQ
jgi:hypothetical protein